MHALTAIALVAEEKILEAQREGAFDNLPGSGKPLCLDDDAHLPPDMRMAYKILKNSGYIAEDNGIKATPKIGLENSEECLGHNRLTRFAVMYSRLQKTRQKTGGIKPELHPDVAAAVLDVAVHKSLEDSPYFDKILQKF
jgi:hypothetical protein